MQPSSSKATAKPHVCHNTASLIHEPTGKSDACNREDAGPQLKRSSPSRSPLRARNLSFLPTSPVRQSSFEALKRSCSSVPSKRAGSDDQRRLVSTSRSTQEEALHAGVDWDDPVLSPAFRSQTPASPARSDSSDLPEPAWAKKGAKITAGPSRTGVEIGEDEAAGDESLDDARISSRKAPKSKSASSGARAALREARIAGKQLKKREREDKLAARQADVERIKAMYPPFSYDSGDWTCPKVWYYKGTGNGRAEHVPVEHRKGMPPLEARPLEDVLTSLKGLGRLGILPLVAHAIPWAKSLNFR